MVAALAVNLGQTGFLFLPEKLNMDIKRLNPISGLKRIFSITSFMRLMFGLIKVGIVVGVSIASLWNKWETILAMAAVPFHDMCIFLVETVLMTVFKIGGALFLLALMDYLFQRWKMEKDLMMTDEEMRLEIRSLTGDPHVMARRRVIQRQMAMNRISNVIPNADFINTNPTELAIAIKYDMETMPAPVVIAKGAGLLAQRIRRLALEHDIPIIERKELARALYEQVDVNEQIPTEHYAAVAEILRYVYELKGKTLPTNV
jgi:flagellar biosynthetic protein FlhB